MHMHRVRRGRTPVVAVVGTALVALLGNMRPAVSETTYATRPALETGVSATTPLVSTANASSPDGRPASRALVDCDDASLVPAIFAWDPDVRFVYFRHVSKWM